MPGFLAFSVAIIGRSAAFSEQVRPVIGLIAAVLAAVLAGSASWHLTDRLVAWRRRADQDEL
ncbi:hypothetical protein NE236_06895 [Actinoallomurus purpureus]|uniref:hypothetical protein n=1 Tax=Actinoallomurus purpureus TaxID=478114 RepID=UPI002092C35D|nr:hypothetical protein [Actinoallomurus purpureus]MCO6004703.1 hypothetical protein [Actinoallomurus purpureus]